jgi:hypothetical protein
MFETDASKISIFVEVENYCSRRFEHRHSCLVKIAPVACNDRKPMVKGSRRKHKVGCEIKITNRGRGHVVLVLRSTLHHRRRRAAVRLWQPATDETFSIGTSGDHGITIRAIGPK